MVLYSRITEFHISKIKTLITYKKQRFYRYGSATACNKIFFYSNMNSYILCKNVTFKTFPHASLRTLRPELYLILRN